MNRDFLKSAKKWEKAGKKRFYINLTGSLKKAGIYWTEDENDRARYTLALAGGYINASKCYNGSLQEKVAELGGTGELI